MKRNAIDMCVMKIFSLLMLYFFVLEFSSFYTSLFCFVFCLLFCHTVFSVWSECLVLFAFSVLYCNSVELDSSHIMRVAVRSWTLLESYSHV